MAVRHVSHRRALPPPGDVLHGLVRDGLAELQAVVERADRSLPRIVTWEVDGYPRGGDPREGFA